MATIGPKPQSWSSLASRIYGHLDNEVVESARATHEKFQEDLLRPWGLVRTARAAQAPDWWSNKGGPKK
jgi:hypothetical protein